MLTFGYVEQCGAMRGAMWSNWWKFFYGTQSVAVAGDQVDRTPSPPVCDINRIKILICYIFTLFFI